MIGITKDISLLNNDSILNMILNMISYSIYDDNVYVGHCEIILNKFVSGKYEFNAEFGLGYKYKTKPIAKKNNAYLSFIMVNTGKKYGLKLLLYVFNDLKLNKVFIYSNSDHLRWNKIAKKIGSDSTEKSSIYYLTSYKIKKYLHD